MAPLVKEFQKHADEFETKVRITAQHREMLDQVLSFFEIKPDYDLDLMKPNQNLYSLTADIITGLKPVLEEFGTGCFLFMATPQLVLKDSILVQSPFMRRWGLCF